MRLLLLALLCLIAYAPSLSIPLIEDDYPNLAQAQDYGAPAALPALLRNGTFRLRATSYWAMYALWNTFHLTPWVYHVASLMLHVACAWLVYAIGMAWPPMRPAAWWAAAFFAVHEGHQEAVMWFSAINELLMFLFGAGALLCWILGARRRVLLVAAVVLFALALVSKESAVIFLPLFVLARPRPVARLLPFAILAALAVASVWAARAYTFRLTDGSFSFHAPFWITWPRGLARLLWIWGWLACAVIFLKGARRPGWLALAWMGIGLVPYSFLTYSTRIPSRQTYLASAGLAFLVGLAMARLAARPRLLSAVAAVILVSNVGWIWTRKRTQFIARAEPTEQLIRAAGGTAGPIWVRCFPRPPIVAAEAVHMALGRPAASVVFTPAEAARHKPAATFCYEAP